MFSGLMDRAVESHFRRLGSGRLVFIPYSLKGKCYFVDSKSDEQKLRALVKMYRSSISLLSLLTYPIIYISALILDVFGGLTPRGHRLAIAIGIPMFLGLLIVALMLMLWVLYKQAVPSFTASMSEVGPEVKPYLTDISAGRRKVVMVCLGALLLLLGLFLFAIQRRPPAPCPPQGQACRQLDVDSSRQVRPQS
jgi:hypothetical protein